MSDISDTSRLRYLWPATSAVKTQNIPYVTPFDSKYFGEHFGVFCVYKVFSKRFYQSFLSLAFKFCFDGSKPCLAKGVGLH